MFEQATLDYKELYLHQYLTNMVFQAANRSDYAQSIALAEWIVFRNAAIFKSPELYDPKNKVLKHLYDVIRIISLKLCSSLNKLLIGLFRSSDQHISSLKSWIIQQLVLIVKVTKLFWSSDKHSQANIYNIEYSLQKFKDVID